ncbi:MAG: hypothetical protein ACW981_14380 [Candidatus Hodarchaeales archaeon]|jgi:hypothetical protein
MISKKFWKKLTRKRRGQVFVLASLLLVVYAVSIIAILSELSVTKLNNQNEGDLNEVFSDLVIEADKHNSIIMARISQGIIPLANAQNEISTFFTNYSTFLLDKSVFATINILNIDPSPDIRSVSTGLDVTSILAYINVSIQISLTSGISNENLQFTSTLFTGYQAIYDQINSLWYISRVNEDLEIIEPILGAQFYLNSVLTPPSVNYNGYYEIGPDLNTEIRLPNGIYLYN